MTLLGFLVLLLIFCVVVWAAREIMKTFNMPPQIQTVVTVVIVLVFVLWLVEALGGVHFGGPLRLR